MSRPPAAADGGQGRPGKARTMGGERGWRSAAMAALALAFLLRVVGQAALMAGWAPWLPPPAEWQSGLLPYPALLASQVVILGFLAVALRDVATGGRLASPGRFAPAVRAFALVYAGSMAVRYVLTRLAHPEWGAFGHTIPIWLHLALAAWLWLWAADAGSRRRALAGGRMPPRGGSAGP
jgi:hypothetical protein